MYAQLFTTAGKGFKPNTPSPFFGLDAARWCRETMAPQDYINGDYFSYWLAAICSFVHDYGPSAIGINVEDLIRLKITSREELNRNAAMRRISYHQQVPGVSGPKGEGQLAGLYKSSDFDPEQAGSIETIGEKSTL